MKHPIYHLRPNKIIDRLMLIELLQRLFKREEINDYTYYSLGGPFLEDFRLMYEFFPKIKMVSIEQYEETYKRQEFHLPCSSLELKTGSFRDFISRYSPADNRSIFWLDYTKLEYSNFEEFETILQKVAENSIIKITLRANCRDYFSPPRAKRNKKWVKFLRIFDHVLPTQNIDLPRTPLDFSILLQDMLKISSQLSLQNEIPFAFQPISSFYYSDGTNILTLTGIVCRKENIEEFKRVFEDWNFANLDWSPPTLIDVPILSTKERLHLQRYLPCEIEQGTMLSNELGYLIDEEEESALKLQQYAIYHKYSPYFMKATP